MKDREEIEAMRDRIGSLVTGDELDGTEDIQWAKLEATEAMLDWVLGEADGFERLIIHLEHKYDG